MRWRTVLTAFVFTFAVVMSERDSLVKAAQSGNKACQGGYSSSFALTGQVNNPATYDKVKLGRLPHSIVNVTFLSKSGSQSSSFGGVLLWNLLLDYLRARKLRGIGEVGRYAEFPPPRCLPFCLLCRLCPDICQILLPFPHRMFPGCSRLLGRL